MVLVISGKTCVQMGYVLIMNIMWLSLCHNNIYMVIEANGIQKHSSSILIFVDLISSFPFIKIVIL